ncbi:Tm-1-like ATP-binding domain-containing protein [Microvirga sp. P5_D2]
MNKVYIIGTCDTKEHELLYAKRVIEATAVPALLVDIGTRSSSNAADVTAEEVAAYHPRGRNAVLGSDDRGESVAAMSEALLAFMKGRADIGGVLGMGGSGNTAIVTTMMRSLPIGTPKIMVSTVASGNVAPYVGPNDIAMMYSVADVAGLNVISRKVIGNAAHGIAGMVKWPIRTSATDKLGVGISMFGVTTACVTQVREALEPNYDCFVFHATGTGGQSMEKLADSGLIGGMIDITTTEVPDYLVGGVFPCTEDRFGAVARTQVPYIGSVGAVDMVNWGARETVPTKFHQRKLYVHNEQVTLMRTTPEENVTIGEFIATRLNRCEGDVRLLLPLGGVSAIDAPGMPFYDPEANEALFSAIRRTFNRSDRRQLIELPYNINDPGFAAAIIQNFREIA